ncbi:DinB family protein [Piscibacillus halophilus]|uniref:DinB superfamily protein n=1 Tax=Piscibacillus halophilus TaxID=571933 RepID=A0A1H9KM74_9BACI|nr:DinB family protein [Piscibacillus halophilus]SER00025.1 DinB superfamily protein [Piscibacillus halophilus]
MVHARAVLINQLLANANDRSWYASFEETVEGISYQEAFWKPDEESHSIAEIVQHLIYWNEVWQVRFEKSNFHSVQSMKDNAASFLLEDNISFTELKEKLLEILLRWEKMLSDDKLESRVDGFPVEAEWWALIGNAATHNAYHIGQINYIRKMKKG